MHFAYAVIGWQVCYHLDVRPDSKVQNQDGWFSEFFFQMLCNNAGVEIRKTLSNVTNNKDVMKGIR